MLENGVTNGSTLQLSRTWLECTDCLFEPTAFARLRARFRRVELDRVLADGVDPTGSPLLAARAAQLVRPRSRARLAEALERLALTAEAQAGRFRVAPRRQAVQANRATLLDLAGRLRRGGPLYARGIAMLELVLIDGTGPAYRDAHGEGLARQLELAGAGLGG
jgi:hypothetical protein